MHTQHGGDGRVWVRQIVRANLTNADLREAYIDLDEHVGREIKFYYSVAWSENRACVVPLASPRQCW